MSAMFRYLGSETKPITSKFAAEWADMPGSPTERDRPELADVAARTFPLACPPSATPDNIAAFIAENLTQMRFAEYVADPERVVLTARGDGPMLGYAMLIRGVVDDADVQRAVPLRPAGGP